MEKPNLETCTEKQASKWYWSAFNEKCIKCKHTCKQSHVAIQVICKNFEE
jgi:hypothetical protein